LVRKTDKEHIMNNRVSRRGFLGVLTATASIIGLFGGTSTSRAAGSSEKWVKVGKPDDFTMGDARLIKEEKIYVLRDDRGIQAISAACTHLGCVVDRLSDGTYLCPCHSSSFDARGLVTRGPAKQPLVWYQTKQEGGFAWVNVKGQVSPK
jgi:Rieske Fe-S protein